jgi:alpha-1,2-mannosyltransferase
LIPLGLDLRPWRMPTSVPGARAVSYLAAGLTPRRLTRWGVVLFGLSVFVYVHTMMVPGLIDRVGRFKGTDYIYFYVSGSFVLEGRPEALYDPAAHLAEGRRRIHPDLQLYAAHPNYGPQVALAFAPLAALPFSSSLAVFLAITALFYGLSVWLLWRECDALQRYGWLVAILAAASPLFWNLIRYGQASAVTLLLWSVAFVALRRNRPFLAGVAIGCLAFKPQLGILPGVVLLAACQWRVVAGALVAVAGQLGVGWLGGGSSAMAQYFGELWRLTLNPGLIELYPSEVHSLRGFFQLLVPSPGVVSACALTGLLVGLIVAVRCWSSSAPLGVRWGQMVLLTILVSPHLVSYDLVLLTIAMLTFADWAVRHPDHEAAAPMIVMLSVLYFAPFSGMIIARLTGVQVSVIVMAILTWRIARVCGTSASVVGSEPDDRRAEAGHRVVPELEHARVAVEY